jgi:hypothetical protein
MVGWPLESGRDVRVQTCVNKYESVPKESGPVKKGVSTCPRSRQVVNRSHIGKCSNHDRLIMKAGRMKNRDVRIMYVLQPLSAILYTRDVLWKICSPIRNIQSP